MADIVDKATRSRMMSGIRGKNTKPEILLRRGLFAEGFRFRLHDRRLPGKPDIVFPRFRAVILAHGCFWHGHRCPLFKWPSSNVEFWTRKIERNRELDREAGEALAALGWRILTVWECALKGPGRFPVEHVVQVAAKWLSSGVRSREVVGREKK